MNEKMQFYRDVQKAARGIPFPRRKALARFAKRRWEAGERDPEAVVAAFMSRRNPLSPQWKRAAVAAVVLGGAFLLSQAMSAAEASK